MNLRHGSKAMSMLERWEDDEKNGEFFAKLNCPCMVCRHHRPPFGRRAACDLFPHGIPAPILSGEDLHTESYSGHGGLKFNPDRKSIWWKYMDKRIPRPKGVKD
jgi:hypothetical protein